MKIKVISSADKVVVTGFCGVRGLLVIDYLEKGENDWWRILWKPIATFKWWNQEKTATFGEKGCANLKLILKFYEKTLKVTSLLNWMSITEKSKSVISFQWSNISL